MARNKKPKRVNSISLREVARIAGVSPATASLAMKNSPRLAEKTKETIRRIARENGYRPNPRLSRILSETVTSRYGHHKGLIYLVITRYTSEIWNRDNPWFLALSDRCRELGYALEPFCLFDPDSTPAKANKLMHSRGVAGLIIHPPPYSLRKGSSLTLPIEWEKFCVVEIDDVITEPVLHHVRHDHLDGIWLALREMEALGYRRIGLCLSHDADLAAHHRWSAGFSHWADMRGFSGPDRLHLRYNGDPQTLREWITSKRLDAVIGLSKETLEAIESTGIRVPQDVGFAALDVEFSAIGAGTHGDPFIIPPSFDAIPEVPEPAPAPPVTEPDAPQVGRIAGVVQCRLGQYSLAADMLASLIARGARGGPALSSSWILAGRWQPGESCPLRHSPSSTPALEEIRSLQ